LLWNKFNCIILTIYIMLDPRGAYGSHWPTSELCPQDSQFNIMGHCDLCFIAELHDIILDHIHNLFMTSSIEMKCSIIGMLNKFVQNLVSFLMSVKIIHFVYKSSKMFLKRTHTSIPSTIVMYVHSKAWNRERMWIGCTYSLTCIL
jgi:hypothetical protein